MNIQMILALGAMVLLSLIIINVNKTSLFTEDTMYDSSFGILATSLASSVIEEASRKHFDENSMIAQLSSTTDLTSVGGLGRESGENVNDPTTFDDFDDYNNYARVDSSMPSAIFNVSSKVCYVDPLYPDIEYTTKQTWHKKIMVTISSAFMRDTIKQSSVYSYFNFR